MVPVTLEYGDAGDATQVCIAGSWTDWEPAPMMRDTTSSNSNNWVYVAELPAATTVDFKFVVDGEWKTSDKYDLSNDGHGSNNNCIYVTRPLTCVASPSDGLSVTSLDPVVSTTPSECNDNIHNNSDSSKAAVATRDESSNLVERLSDEVGELTIYEEVAQENSNDDIRDAVTQEKKMDDVLLLSGDAGDDGSIGDEKEGKDGDGRDDGESKPAENIIIINKKRGESGMAAGAAVEGTTESEEGIEFETAVKGGGIGCVLV